MAYRSDWIGLIRTLARKYGVDPRAVLAVASSEGLSGGVGDQGTSYGPFQLHRGGALPAGRDRAWAESPAGIEYALRQIAGVAKGLQGREAIDAIVRRFERPADPSGEVDRAWGAYGSFAGGGGPTPPPAAGAPGLRALPLVPKSIPMPVLSAVNQSLSSVAPAVSSPSLAPMKLPKFVPATAPTPPLMPAAKAATPVAATAPLPVNARSEFANVDAEGAPDAKGVRHHAAYDWMLGGNAPVPALVGGTVIEAKPSSGDSGQVYGGTVKIQTADGRVLVYRHVSPNVKVGQRVQPGAVVARVVRWRDNPSSSHTHMELWRTRAGGYRYENMIDPLGLIPRSGR